MNSGKCLLEIKVFFQGKRRYVNKISKEIHERDEIFEGHDY